MSNLQSADNLSADFADSIGREKVPDDYGTFLNMFSDFLPPDDTPNRKPDDEGSETDLPPPALDVPTWEKPIKKPPGDTPPILPKTRVTKTPNGEEVPLNPHTKPPVFRNRSPDIIVYPTKNTSEKDVEIKNLPGDTPPIISGEKFDVKPKANFWGITENSWDGRGSGEIRADQFRSNEQSNKLNLFNAPSDFPPPPISPLESEPLSVFQIASNNMENESEVIQIPTLEQVQNSEATDKDFNSQVSENIGLKTDSNKKFSSEISSTKTFTSNHSLKAEYDEMEYSVESPDFNPNNSDKFQMETPEINNGLPKENLLNIQKASLNLEKFSADVSKDKTQVQGINSTDKFQKAEDANKSIDSFAQDEFSEPINLDSSSKDLSDMNNSSGNSDRRSELPANVLDFGDTSLKIIEKFSVESAKAVENLSEQMSENKELVLNQIEEPILEFAAFTQETNEPQLLKLRLNPVELGEITVKLEKNAEGNLNIHFQTENDEVGDMLVETFDQLKTAIQDSGWQVEEMEMSSSNFLSDGFNNSEENSQKERFTQSQKNEMNDFGETSENTDDSSNEGEDVNRLVSLRA